MTEYFGSRKTIKRPYGHREEEEDEPAQRGNESYSKNCDDGSESNEEVPQKKVAKKAASSSSSRSNESGENGIFDIGGKRKINVKGNMNKKSVYHSSFYLFYLLPFTSFMICFIHNRIPWESIC